MENNTLADKLFLLGEMLLLLASSFAASYINSFYQPIDQELSAINAVLFTGCVMLCALSVGLYDQKTSRGYRRCAQTRCDYFIAIGDFARSGYFQSRTVITDWLYIQPHCLRDFLS